MNNTKNKKNMNVKKRIFIPMILLTIGCGLSMLLFSIMLFSREPIVGHYTEDDTNKILFSVVTGGLIALAVLGVCLIIASFTSGRINQRLNDMVDEIRKADEYTSLLLDATPLSCVLWNQSLKSINLNTEALKLFELDTKEEFDDRFPHMMPELQPNGENSIEGASKRLKQAFLENYSRFEWLHKLESGELLPCEITLVRVKHIKEYYVAGFMRDLREQKAAHEKIHNALEQAEIANNAKSAFLANISHEIRTPMNSIIGFSELALDDEISKQMKGYLECIHSSAQWLLNIVDDVLDISKIETRNVSVAKIPLYLTDIFTQCHSAIMPKAEEKGLSLVYYAEPPAKQKLLGDPAKLRQIIMNLLYNSVKFTESGTVKLLASVSSSDSNSITMNFEIKDTGIGMSDEQIEKVFDPFMQGDNSVTRKFGGAGLGLPITKRFIEMMGGKLKVESKVGFGSCFSFRLKFDFVDTQTTEHLKHEEKIISGLERPNFNGEVLVCEDNVLNQQVVCEHLLKVGLRAVVANNGQEAVDIITEHLEKERKPFDLIFMDIHMPVMDGLDASCKIMELGVKTPIVALTANIMDGSLELYKKCGINSTVGKPFTAQELWTCLVNYLPVESYTVLDNNDDDDNNNNNKQVETPINEAYDNDMDLDTQMKTYFVQNNQDTYAQIREALNSNDIKTAHRLVHSLKSNAGYINEERLQKACAVVEKALKATPSEPLNDNMETDMNVIESELTSILEKLSPFMSGSVTPVYSDDSSPNTTEADETAKNSILIVDDQITNITALKSILGKKYKIYVVIDSREAVKTAEQNMPDVILLDVVMPELDGYQIITELKKSKKAMNIPVIFITGLDDAVAEKKGLSLGAVDYITKPFNSAIVKLRVHNQIKLFNHIRALEERDELKRQLELIKELEVGLIKAKESAEHSSRAKSEFLSRMSHEMLTPMNAIMGMLQLIQVKGVPEGLKNIYDEARTASNQLLKMIDDVLDVSSVEYGSFKLTESRFSFKDMTDRIIKDAIYNSSKKQQTFTSDIDTYIPHTISGDEKRLEQVITSLIANAIKFTGENGEVSFSAKLVNEYDDKLILEMQVSDNGIGLSPAQQSDLFTLFEQVDGSNTRQHAGIGIGLPLSKRIIEMMNGSIWVESEFNKGSKFIFTCEVGK
jgi:signal transduction histidine kinase/HPt (histidine-containing phosphotransfer) domain-containing protein